MLTPRQTLARTAARKISGLYTAYWNGWDAAGAEYWLGRRCADEVAGQHRKSIQATNIGLK